MKAPSRDKKSILCVVDHTVAHNPLSIATKLKPADISCFLFCLFCFITCLLLVIKDGQKLLVNKTQPVQTGVVKVAHWLPLLCYGHLALCRVSLAPSGVAQRRP